MMKVLKLRDVQDDDCRMIWEWANDKEARNVSFSQESIRWEDHQQWFLKRIEDPDYAFYIALDEDGEALGQVRFQIESDRAVISISLAKKYRGKGLGSLLIQEGCKRLFENSNVEKVDAYIKEANVSSLGAFEKAGFERVESLERHGLPTLRLELKR